MRPKNWHNWAIALVNGSETWYLRADAWSNASFTGATVGYNYTWDWASEFKNVFNNKEVRVKISKVGTTINVFAFVGGKLVYNVSSVNSPAGAYTVYLGGESVYIDLKKVSVGKLGARQLVGTVKDDGTYPSAFNTNLGQTTAVSGDFELHYNFNNYHNALSKDNWDNFILRAISASNPMLLRADAAALDAKGTMNYTYDWDWVNFLKIISGANIDLTITRKAGLITYTSEIAAKDGQSYNYKVTNTGGPTSNMSFGFTCEESMVDILRVEKIATVGGEVITSIEETYENTLEIFTDGATVFLSANDEGKADVFDLSGRKVQTIQFYKGLNKYSDLHQGVYIINRTKVVVLR